MTELLICLISQNRIIKLGGSTNTLNKHGTGKYGH